MKIDFNVVLKVLARVTILFGLFGAIIPLFSFLSTKNLYQHVIESTKDEHDVEFPTLLKSPQVVQESVASTNFNTSDDSFIFAFPLKFLQDNIKYGLPEIELFFSLSKNHCNRDTMKFYTMDILETLRGSQIDENIVLRENLISVQGHSGCSSKSSGQSYVAKIWEYVFPSIPAYNGEVKTSQLADGIYKLIISQSNSGNVVLENAPTYLDTEHDLYVLEIKVMINYPPKIFPPSICKPNLVVFDGSSLSVRKDIKQLNIVKKFMVQYRLISMLLLFVIHYMLLSVSILLSSSISALVFC